MKKESRRGYVGSREDYARAYVRSREEVGGAWHPGMHSGMHPGMHPGMHLGCIIKNVSEISNKMNKLRFKYYLKFD